VAVRGRVCVLTRSYWHQPSLSTARYPSHTFSGITSIGDERFAHDSRQPSEVSAASPIL
jgi:hypothetical protein